ncbi:unnamed protein product [Somion occarium]|uniref:Uncharacterized protein n=1 Tax=Somion occarium TaxID=3059160 RepID=A0ABP1D552_9APHY
MRSFKHPDSEQAILDFLDPEERDVYHRTKDRFEGTFFIETFHLKNITEKETLTIHRDRIVNGKAHYLIFFGPLRPIDKLGKAYDVWLDTTPDEEAIYYKCGSGGWAHWEVAADVSFPGTEREPRHLMFLPTRRFSIVGWFVMPAHHHIARIVLNKNDMVRLAYLSLTVRHGFTVFCKNFPPPLWSSLDQQLNRMRNDDNLLRYVKLALHNISKSDIKTKVQSVQMNAFPLEMRFAVKAWTDGRQLHEADHETGYSLLVINRPGQQRMNLARFRRGRGKPWDSSFSMLYTCTLDRRIRLEYSFISGANNQSAILHLFPSMYYKLDGKAVHIMIKFETTDSSSAKGKGLRSFFEDLLPFLLLSHVSKRFCLEPLWNTMYRSAADTQRKSSHLASVQEKRLNDELEPQEHNDEEDSPRPFGNRVNKLHSDSEYVPSDEDDSTPSSQRRKRYPLRHFKAIVMDSDSGSYSGDNRDEIASSRGQRNTPTQDNPRASSHTPTPSNTSSTRPSLSVIRALKSRSSASKTNLAKQATQENDKDQSNRNHQGPDESLKSLGGQATLGVSSHARSEPLVAEVAKLNDDREHNDETSEGKIRGDDVGPAYDLTMENQRPVDGDAQLPSLDVDRKPNVQELDECHLLSAVSLQGAGSIDQPIVIDDDEDLRPLSTGLGGPLVVNTAGSAPSVGGALGYIARSPLVDDSMHVEPTPDARPETIVESNQDPLTIASFLVNSSDLETSVQSNGPDITNSDAPKGLIIACGSSSGSVKTEDLTEDNSGGGGGWHGSCQLVALRLIRHLRIHIAQGLTNVSLYRRTQGKAMMTLKTSDLQSGLGHPPFSSLPRNQAPLK